MSVPPSAPSRAVTYRAVLRTPRSRRPFAAALLGRLSYGVVPLALILTVQEATGSYASAGTAMALFGLTSVLLSPARAALIDRYGARRALPPMTLGYAALLLALAAVTRLPDPSAALLVGAAAVTGAFTPPLGAVVRAVWSRLLPDRQLLQRAYSLDGVAEELLYVSGPLLAGLLAALLLPAAGLVVGAALVLVGGICLATSPAVRMAQSSSAATVDAVHDEGASAGRRSVVRALRAPIAAAAGLGLCIGAVELLVVAFADQQHRASAVSWVLAALSAGSAVGGLTYGAVNWRVPERVRLPLLVTGLGLTLAPAGLSPHLYVLIGAAGLAGIFVAPALTTAYLIADASVPAGDRTRAGAWVNTAFNAGASAGAALYGLLVGRVPLSVCFALAAAPVLLAAAASITRPKAGKRPGPASSRSGPAAGTASEPSTAQVS
ncbi:MFS transporter [Streptomyces sp. A5-4]|uniref:MFS transporter n=1 Tax=Streptomyces sp. A5-4 TaxID=3384771 RepID=UPI003DA9DC68